MCFVNLFCSILPVVPTECDVLIVCRQHNDKEWKFKEQHAKMWENIAGAKRYSRPPVVSTLRWQVPPPFRRLWIPGSQPNFWSRHPGIGRRHPAIERRPIPGFSDWKQASNYLIGSRKSSHLRFVILIIDIRLVKRCIIIIIIIVNK